MYICTRILNQPLKIKNKMKKQILGAASIALVALSLVNTGCKKGTDDTTKPVITVVGSNPYYIQKSTVWSDPGATASDDVDGTILAQTSDSPLMSATGTYTITYISKDKAGNQTTATRTVNVVDIDGYYATVLDYSPDTVGVTPSNYNETMHLSNTGSGRVDLTKFADYTNGSVYFNMTSPTALTVPSQTVSCGSTGNVASRTFSGSGTISTTSTPSVSITFTEVTNGTTIHSRDTYAR